MRCHGSDSTEKKNCIALFPLWFLKEIVKLMRTSGTWKAEKVNFATRINIDMTIIVSIVKKMIKIS